MTTYHAIQRVKQRTSLERGSEERFIKNAVARGRGAESFESIEREYLKSYDSADGCRAVAYNSYCFIIGSNGRCITMFALPNWFGKKRNYHKKSKLRDVTKYTLGCLLSYRDEETSEFAFA